MEQIPTASTAHTAAAPNPGSCGCGGGGKIIPSPYIYAVGTIHHRFPSLAIEKEFAQVMGSPENLGNFQAVHRVCSQKESRYLVRHICWVLAIEGIDSYILKPRDPDDYELLVDAIRPSTRQDDRYVVVGVRGPIAPEQACNGAALPVVGFDQLWRWNKESLLKAAPRSDAEDSKLLLQGIMQLASNLGTADSHRAINYLLVRYPAIAVRVIEANAHDAIFSAVESRPSSLGAERKIVDVIFSYTAKGSGVVEKQFTRVDVTEEFPFLVSPLSPYVSC